MNYLSNEEATKTDKIYHGCYTRNADGKMIPRNFMNGERCLILAEEKYWKKPKDPRRKSPRRVKNKIRRCSNRINQK